MASCQRQSGVEHSHQTKPTPAHKAAGSARDLVTSIMRRATALLRSLADAGAQPSSQAAQPGSSPALIWLSRQLHSTAGALSPIHVEDEPYGRSASLDAPSHSARNAAPLPLPFPAIGTRYCVRPVSLGDHVRAVLSDAECAGNDSRSCSATACRRRPPTHGSRQMRLSSETSTSSTGCAAADALPQPRIAKQTVAVRRPADVLVRACRLVCGFK